MNASRFHIGWCMALLLAVALAGCATKKINWASRIGTYTFEQTVLEIGPPDKKETFKDGMIVAEWLTHRGYSQVYATGGFYGPPYGGWGFAPTYIDTYTPDYFLRLTFGPDGRLQAWKRFAR